MTLEAASASKACRDHQVHRQAQPAPAFRQQLPGSLQCFFFHQGIADRVALRLEEGVRHAAADQHLVSALLSRLRITPILSLIFGAAQDGDEGFLGISNRLAQVLDFFFHQEAATAGRRRATPSVEAWARCAEPKASLT